MITDERLGGETVAYGEMYLCMGNTATRMREKAWDQGELGCHLRQLKLFTYMSLNLILCNGCNAEHLLRGNAIADSCSSFENEIHERRCLCLHACLYALTAWKMLAPGTHSPCCFAEPLLCIQDVSRHLVISKILSSYNFFTFFGCWDRVLLFRPGWPGTLCGYEVGLKFTELYLILYPKGWH